MGQTFSQQAYAQSVGTAPTGFPWIDTRDPTTIDVNFPIGQFWINRGAAKLWYLNSKSNAITSTNLSGQTLATWELISVSSLLASISDTANTPVFPSSNTATPPDNIQLVGGVGINIVANPGSNLLTISNTGSGTETVTGDDSVAVSPSVGGTIFTIGNIVANGTHAKALFTTNSAPNTERWDLQLAAAIAATDVTKVGVAAFDNAQFAVDANGFVKLAGGTTAPVLSLTPDAHTAPGTTPVLPSGTGTITIEGGTTFATGTQANPIRTNSLAANKIDLQIQLAGSNAAVSTANDFGVSQFDANHFTVASGFVQIKNGGTTGAITQVNLDAGTSPIVPSAGAITLTGAQVAAGTTTNVIRIDGTGANTAAVQIQRSQAAGVSTVGDNGVCHFSSTQFGVDANGFVTLAGGTGAGVLTLTGNSGGAIGPSSGNINTVGTGSITIAGAGNTLTTQLTGLTNHAVLIGAGTATITNVGPTATSGQILQSQGAAADPAFSTATYPATTTINRILYSSATNVVDQIVTANNGVLTTGTSGIPNITPLSSNGQIIIGSSGGAPAANTITAGAGISITNGANSITISASSANLPWSDEGGSFSALSNNGYFVTAVATASLPASPAQGDVIKFILDSASTLTIQASTGKIIRIGAAVSAASGTAASSGTRGDAVALVYRSANTTWIAEDVIGTWSVT